MRIIHKIDIIFLLITSFVILFAGFLALYIFERIIIVPIILIAEFFYLNFALKKFYSRFKAVKEDFPEEWKDYIKERSSFYNNLDKKKKKQFEKDVKIFLSEVNIEGIKGEKIDFKTKLLIAAGIATVINGRPDWEIPLMDGIVVYPGSTFNNNYQVDKGNYAGQAPFHGPMILTRKSLEYSFGNLKDGFNVLYHELAHFFDWEDGRAEGLPFSRLLSGNIFPWKEVIYDEWKKAKKGKSFLGSYAGKNEAELFAVATEYFFENPNKLKKKAPKLYKILKDFYNLDTVNILK